MKERKQSFLERLTGAQVVDETFAEGTRAGESTFDGRSRRRQVDRGGTNEESTANFESMPKEQAEEESEDAGLAIDMYESRNELIIQSMIAGVTPENLHITITRDAVTLRGKRVAPHDIPEENYRERELYWGSFSREIALPFAIDTDGAEAVEKYGLLIIRLPKLDATRTQELKVKSI